MADEDLERDALKNDPRASSHVQTPDGEIADATMSLSVAGTSDSGMIQSSESSMTMTTVNGRNAAILPRLERMPFVVTSIIFEILGLCDATCLGLTCSALYLNLKTLHQNPISLFIPQCAPFPVDAYNNDCVCQQPGCHRLDARLQSWIGHQYRNTMYPYFFLPFRNINVHGNQGSKDVDKVQLDKYQDYRKSDPNAAARQSVLRYSPKPIKEKSSFNPILPNPYNMGERWYELALGTIAVDLERFRSVGEWEEFWGKFVVFRNNKKYFEQLLEDWRFDTFADGVEWLGL